MSWVPYATYRGCALHYSTLEPRIFWSPCITYPVESDPALRHWIDEKLGPEPEPEPEPPEDYLADTYRGIEIWWLEGPHVFRAYIAGWGTAVTETLEEIYPYIDEALEWLEPPEEPEEGLFAQVVAAIKTWMLKNLPDWLLKWGKYIDNTITYLDKSINYWGDQITQYVDNSINYWGDVIEKTFIDARQWIDNSITNIDRSVHQYFTDARQYITNVIGVSDEVLNQRLIDTTKWVRDFFKLMDPMSFLEDPFGFIDTGFNTLIAPWAEGIVKSFWEGFEEGQAE